MLHTARCIILSSIFNFEIIVDSEKAVKLVQRVLRIFFIQFPLTVTCDITGQYQNQATDTGACVCIVLKHFITQVDSCKHQLLGNQGTELLHHHKDLPGATLT